MRIPITLRFLALAGLGRCLLLGPAPLAAQATAPGTAQATASAPGHVAPRLIDDLRYLADDRLAGRLTGSPGADSAAEYLMRRFRQVGLQPASTGWFQPFEVSPRAPGAKSAGIGGRTGRNVVAILPGRDPVLRNQTVVIGAHYDHLGLGGFGALDAPDSTGKVHNGADDNASGTAALVAIASQLAHAPPARTVVFIAFSGEEEGLLGSAAYVRNAPYPLASTVAMINLDMVGRLRNDKLIVMGTGSAREFPALLDSLNWYAGFDLRQQPDGWGRSDQSSFLAAKRPVLFLFTDLHEDYHRTTDDVDKINIDGLKRVVDFTVGLATALGNRRAPLTFVETAPPATTLAAASPHGSGSGSDSTGAPTAGAVSGYGAYLGTIPDMSDSPGGVRLSGVRSGSPAEQAGLKADDIIVRIGTMDVPDLQAMTDALRSHKPGDVVDITVLRGTTRTTVRATLGTRGG